MLIIRITVPEKYQPVDTSVKSFLGSLLGGCKPLKGRVFEISLNYSDLYARPFWVAADASGTSPNQQIKGIGPRSIEHMNNAVRQALACVRNSCPSHFQRKEI